MTSEYQTDHRAQCCGGDWSLRRVNATVILVLCVFFYLYYVSVFCVVGDIVDLIAQDASCRGAAAQTCGLCWPLQAVPWLSFSVPGLMNVGVLTLTAGLSLYCYMFCVVLDAGRWALGACDKCEGELGVSGVVRRQPA